MGDSKGGIGGAICISIFLLALAIASLAMHTDVPSDLKCDDTSLTRNVGLRNWLIASGAIGICFFVLVIVGACLVIGGGDGAKIAGTVVLVICVLLAIVNFCWNIVGSVIFWRDCHDAVSEKIKDYMYARLIISYIFACSV